MMKRRVNRGIILAAGDGGRLGSLTYACPKVLLAGYDQRPLITYPIEALAASGIREIAIVVGYLGGAVIEALGTGKRFGVRFHYIHNADYTGGNAISAYKAREWAQGAPVVLCMGDHLIEARLIRRLLDNGTGNDTLCVDYTPAWYHQVDEATKVTVDVTGCIQRIGKELIYWDALDTGVFLLTENFFQGVAELIRYRGTDIEMADVIRFLISQGHKFYTCDVSGCSWQDVDTEDDLNLARSR